MQHLLQQHVGVMTETESEPRNTLQTGNDTKDSEGDEKH